MFKKYFALSQLVRKSEERATWFSNLAPKEKKIKTYNKQQKDCLYRPLGS